MLISRFVALSLSIGLFPATVDASCLAQNFLTMPIPIHRDRPAFAVALETAYAGITVDEAAGTLTLEGKKLPLGTRNARPISALLPDASIRDQFALSYPLDFDLDARREPWFDPGRARNDPLFRALYGTSERQAAGRLARVEYAGSRVQARFAMTTRYCVATQLQAALRAIANEGAHMDRFFTEVGGSFNWRQIAGTQRLSAHSFGIAVDFNPNLGGYWRWSGETEGHVGDYDNGYPEALVSQMERFGFIWGGKWHHYDGMHFEYRPELILYSRLRQEGWL